MGIEVISVGSSSSGNSYIIRAGGSTVILDVGLPARRITGALEELGISPDEVDAVLITHEHVDHVKSVRAVSRKCCNAVFCASRGTVEHTQNFAYVPEERLRLVAAGDEFVLGDLSGYSDYCSNVKISAFALSHDAAEPLSYTIEAEGEKLAVVTDTGIISEGIYEAVRYSDLLVLEANHDEHMLMFGEYPYPVKVRIKSDFGHLSNDYAGDVLARILGERRAAGAEADSPLRIMLAHLSFHNNIPLFARQTVEDALGRGGFRSGGDYMLTVAAKEGLTFMPRLTEM